MIERKPTQEDIEADVRALLERIDALDGLLVCYRIGKTPAEPLFKKLERTKVEWQRIRGALIDGTVSAEGPHTSTGEQP